MFAHVIFDGAPICRCGELQSPRLCTRASKTLLAFSAVFMPRLRVARSRTRTASFVDLRCKYNSNYVLLATLARRLRLYSCTVHSARAESADRGARALVPRRRITNERAGPKHTVNMKFTGAKFGSTRIIDQCSGSPLRTTWEPPPHLGPQVFRCRLQP